MWCHAVLQTDKSFKETYILPSSWIWRQQVPPKLWNLSSNKLTNVTSQKTKLLKFTAMITSYLTKAMPNKKFYTNFYITYCLKIQNSASNYKVFGMRFDVYTAETWPSELQHCVTWQMITSTATMKKVAGCQNPENHKLNVPLHIFILTFLFTSYQVVNSPHWKNAHSETYRSHDITTVLPTSKLCTAVMLVYTVCVSTGMCLQYIMPKRPKSSSLNTWPTDKFMTII